MGVDTPRKTVPRSPEPPLAETVAEAMEIGRCYIVADLVAEFEAEDPARNTIRNRLETLAEAGRVERRKHVSGIVTYRRLE